MFDLGPGWQFRIFTIGFRSRASNKVPRYKRVGAGMKPKLTIFVMAVIMFAIMWVWGAASGIDPWVNPSKSVQAKEPCSISYTDANGKFHCIK
jgi:hypothetical protein